MKTTTIILLALGGLIAAGVLLWAFTREEAVGDGKGGVTALPLPAGTPTFSSPGSAAARVLAEAGA